MWVGVARKGLVICRYISRQPGKHFLDWLIVLRPLFPPPSISSGLSAEGPGLWFFAIKIRPECSFLQAIKIWEIYFPKKTYFCWFVWKYQEKLSSTVWHGDQYMVLLFGTGFHVSYRSSSLILCIINLTLFLSTVLVFRYSYPSTTVWSWSLFLYIVQCHCICFRAVFLGPFCMEPHHSYLAFLLVHCSRVLKVSGVHFSCAMCILPLGTQSSNVA